MSGHYQSTMVDIARAEAEAAAPWETQAAVDQSPDPDLLPEPGHHVLYHCRPGEGRRGRNSFPALVMYREESGLSLELLVEYDADDRVMRQGVREQSIEHDHPSFTRIAAPGAEKFEPSRLNKIRTDLDETRAALDKMHANLYGEYLMPDQPLVAIVASFEEALFKLTKRIEALEGTPKAKTKAK